jgi:hypothetical protein
MNKLLEYKLIGIGEFSHGIQESWEFRFNLLKYAMKTYKHKIFIFNEMSVWQAENIMNNTIFSRELTKYINYNKIKIKTPVENNEGSWGKLWQYVNHSSESKIFLQIIKYIRRNKDRIILIGIDNDKLDRDYDMYKIIMKNYDPNNINFLWGHNHHIGDYLLSMDTYKYIKNKNHKFYCGHYLKKKLGDDYCIILSQSYEGENRFNSYCIGTNCEERNWQLKYMYKKFKYIKNKKYVDETKKYQLLTNFNEQLISFSNSYYKENKYGVQEYTKNDKNWNYILFWNKVTKLEPYYIY